MDKRRALAWALFLIGAGAGIWGLVIFLTEPLIWDRALRTIAVGLLIWCLALGAARDYPAAFVRLARLAEWKGRLLRIDLFSPERRLAALGLVTGATAAYLFAAHYLYVFKLLAVQSALVLAGGAAGWLSHLLLYKGIDRASAVFFPDSPWRRAAGVYGTYAAIWAALLAGPFDSWEALGTEPILRQLALGLLSALILAFLALGQWKGREGKIHRPALVIALIALLAACGWNAAQELSRTASPKQRVLLLTLDTTRADYLSCYGYPRETSPNLDALAASGVRFTRAFSNAGLTDPSHASILTGTYPRTHGLTYNIRGITGDPPSLAEYFAERGFVTAAVASRDHVLPAELNVSGFAESIGVRRWIGKTDGPEAFRRAANYLYRHRDRDLFLWVHFFDPHDSYEPHPGISDHFYGKDRGKRHGKLYVKKNKRYSEKEIKYIRDLYAGEIFYMDLWIGKLLKMARELGPVPENPPMVAVIADHGEFLGEYLSHPRRYGFGHGPVYNLGVHVPLILSWPGRIPAGAKIDDIVESIDLAHTVADYALGITNYPGQGESLRKAIEGGRTRNQAVIMHCREKDEPTTRYDPAYAMVKDEFKYMIADSGDGELFDLAYDWEESFDLSLVFPGEAEKLAQAWNAWKEATPEAKPEQREYGRSELKALKALGYIE